MGWGFGIDICPICGCNNAPMVWLGKNKGWICEDCYERREENVKLSDNHNNNLRDNSGSCNNRK